MIAGCNGWQNALEMGICLTQKDFGFHFVI